VCVVSMVMDHYSDKWSRRWPATPGPYEVPPPVIIPVPAPATPGISPEEIKEFRDLLERAREYDRRNNEPDCELDEKRERVRELAERLGVKIDFL
jgi:hypothetical protein